MKHLIAAWQGKRVLVAGDPGHDVYHHGHVDRVSPEAPVPVLVEDSIEDRPAMAYNVCQNLAGLGLVPIQCFPPHPWTVKRRFMARGHQLLRVDYDRRYEATPSDVPSLDGVDCVILSDYAKGWLTNAFCVELIKRANAHNVPVVVDPKDVSWSKFVNATVICPNEKEYAERSARKIYAWQGSMIVKKGAAGMTLYDRDEIALKTFPATAQTVFDVTGAGDTVVTVVAATLAAGGDLYDACRLANLAAGDVVSRIGTSYCTADTLRSLCE